MFFESQIKDGKKPIDSCYKDWAVNLWSENRKEIDFESQKKAYKKINNSTFNEIWSFCRSIYLEKDTLKSVCLNYEGKYLDYLKLLADRNLELKNYVKTTEETGDIPQLHHLHNLFFELDTLNDQYKMKENFKDYNIKVILTINTLNAIDQFYRREKWEE